MQEPRDVQNLDKTKHHTKTRENWNTKLPFWSKRADLCQLFSRIRWSLLNFGPTRSSIAYVYPLTHAERANSSEWICAQPLLLSRVVRWRAGTSCVATWKSCMRHRTLNACGMHVWSLFDIPVQLCYPSCSECTFSCFLFVCPSAHVKFWPPMLMEPKVKSGSVVLKSEHSSRVL